MDFGLQGKVAMVAAGSKGIGLATAKALTSEGCRVAICARTEESLEEASAELPDVSTYIVDVADPADLEWWIGQVVQDLGAPAILVTNTGGPPAGIAGEIDDEKWRQGVDSTLMNVVRMTRLLTPLMVGWGRIVHITSFVAKEPNPILAISSTLRAGLMSLTRLQATELAPKGITVNSVLPGHTMTDRQIHLADVRAEREGITRDQALEQAARSIPLGRLARPDEIASAIAFLCSESASYITGVNLLVDGGLTHGLG